MKFPRRPSAKAMTLAANLTAATPIRAIPFLNRDLQCQRIVEMANLKPHQHVCELGAGFGGVTKYILQENIKSLLSVEWNYLCHEYLNKLQRVCPDILTVKSGDSYMLDYSAEFNFLEHSPWESDEGSDLVIFLSNMPSIRSTGLLMEFIKDMSLRQQAYSYGRTKLVGVFSHNTSRRLEVLDNTHNAEVVSPRLTFLTEIFCQVNCGIDVPGTVYEPISKFHGRVIEIVPRKEPLIENVNYDSINSLLNCLRPKLTIGESLAPHLSRDASSEELFRELDNVQCDADKKCSQLTLEDVAKIYTITHLLEKYEKQRRQELYSDHKSNFVL